MGWAESPPAFCAGTETVADVANATLATNMQSLEVPHCLNAISETVPVDTPVDTVVETENVNKNTQSQIEIPRQNSVTQIWVKS